MLLTELTLFDFRQFKGKQSVTFACDKEKNVTVIMGKNGSGKTTFSQAFTWCLYGKTDFSDKHILCKASAQEMLPGSTKSVKVILKLIHNEILYTVIREQQYQKDSVGKLKCLNNTHFSIAYKGKDGQQEFINELQTDMRMKEILPQELSRYFFFDGERIGNMSKEIQTGRSDEFADAVKSLLGLNSYVAALSHLKGQRGGKTTVIGSYDDQYDSNSDSRIKKYTDEITGYQNKINQTNDNLIELGNREKLAENKCRELDIEIAENKDSEELAKKKANMIEKQNKIESFLDGSTKGLIKKFQQQYHGFFSQKIVIDALIMLSGMEKLDKGIPDIHKRTIDYLMKRGTCICGNKLEDTNDAYNELLKVLEYIPPKSPGTIIHDFVKDCETKIKTGKSLFIDISDQLSIVRDRENELSDIFSDINVLENKLLGMKNVGTLQAKLSTYRKEAKDARLQYNSLKEDLGGFITQQKRSETERTELTLKDDNNRRIEVYKAYAQYMYDTLLNDYSIQEAQTRVNLEKYINEIFKTIYNGGLSLSIDEKYNIQTIVNDFDDYSIGVETSTAQSISIIFAFIAGVIKMARENKITSNEMLVTEAYPLVMDAPLSALDKERIQTVCETLPNIAEQVIIFIKDTDGEIAEHFLLKKTGRRYIFNKRNEFETYIDER